MASQIEEEMGALESENNMSQIVIFYRQD